MYAYIYARTHIHVHITAGLFHFLKLHSLHLPDLEIEGCSLRTTPTYDSTCQILANVHADLPRFLRCNIFPVHPDDQNRFSLAAKYQTQGNSSLIIFRNAIMR